MKKTSKTFTVRGFNIFQESFTNPSGVIEDKRTFKELVADSQTEAIVAMLTDNNVRDLSVPNYDMSDDPKNILHVLDLTISLDTDDKLEVRSVKSALREVMKRWAEKSRVKNRRGWRSSAIKDPTFIYCQGASTEVKIQVILGNAAVYSDDLFDISPITYQQLSADLALLRKELIKRVTYFESLKYKHSIHGFGEVL